MLNSKSIFLKADVLNSPSAWLGHVPFALWIVEMLKPTIFVELGTHYGHSYFAFCKSVLMNGLATKCYAVDTWQGDEHAGQYGENIFQSVTEHNSQNYYSFSRLLRMTFDEAASYFNDGTIDLLHIDGLHTYEAVKHDFETWFPKVSKNGVILFHDINVREREFGVWRLWEELSAKYPSLEFQHSHGLGVLFIGDGYPAEITNLLKDWSNPDGKFIIKNFFSRLGEMVELEAQFRQSSAYTQSLKSTLDTTRNQLDDANAELKQANLKLTQTNLRIDEYIRSTSWRITKPIRFFSGITKRTLSFARRCKPSE